MLCRLVVSNSILSQVSIGGQLLTASVPMVLLPAPAFIAPRAQYPAAAGPRDGLQAVTGALWTCAMLGLRMTARLRALISSLEPQVQERTRSLQRRTIQMETSTKVSRERTSILEANDLLKRALPTRRRRENAG